MGHLILQGDNFTWPGFSLLGEPSLAITMDETGLSEHQILPFLVLSGTTSVSIGSTGAGNGQNFIDQLLETTNNLTTVTISGSEFFSLGAKTFGHNNLNDGVVTDIAATAKSPTTIHSSLKLIDASATTGRVIIDAGGTNTSSDGDFQNGTSLNTNVTITYTGLEIKGGSGDFSEIDNGAKNGIVTEGNGSHDAARLGGANAKATLGTGNGDIVVVGLSDLASGTPGSALGDTVKFGAAATATLTAGTGAEAGSTAGTTSIGLTKVLNAAAGMEINFFAITSSTIVDETATVASSKSLTAAENAAVSAMGSAGVAYFSFHGNEYFIATNNNGESAVSSQDAIVELVGITDIHHAANSGGVVTLHV